MIDYKNCIGHLEDLGIVELEGNTIPVHNAGMRSINEDQTNSISSLGQLPEDVEKELSLPKKLRGVILTMRTSLPNKEHLVVGKDELIHQIAAKAGMNLKETNKVIDAFTDVVREGVSKGYEVRLMGFGTWNLRDVAPRRVKSIRGGDQITIPARKRVGFSVGAVLSQAALGPNTTRTYKTASDAHHQQNSSNGNK